MICPCLRSCAWLPSTTNRWESWFCLQRYCCDLQWEFCLFHKYVPELRLCSIGQKILLKVNDRFACSCQAKLYQSAALGWVLHNTSEWALGNRGRAVGAKLPTSLTQKNCLTASHLSDLAELSNSLLCPEDDSGGPYSVWWGASIYPRSSWNWQKSSQLAVSDIVLFHQTTVHKTRGVRFTILCTVK